MEKTNLVECDFDFEVDYCSVALTKKDGSVVTFNVNLGEAKHLANMFTKVVSELEKYE